MMQVKVFILTSCLPWLGTWLGRPQEYSAWRTKCGNAMHNESMDRTTFGDRLRALEELLEAVTYWETYADYDEDNLRPSEYSLAEMRTVLTGSSRVVTGFYPHGDAYPDGDGGMRIEWVGENCELRLIISAASDLPRYIYHERGDEFANDNNVSPESLGKWINWFNTHAS